EIGDGGHADVAGRADQADAGIAREPPGEGVLAPAGAHNQDSHSAINSLELGLLAASTRFAGLLLVFQVRCDSLTYSDGSRRPIESCRSPCATPRRPKTKSAAKGV